MINYERIGRAIAFYKSRGYHYLEVPWITDLKSIKKTAPEGCFPFRLSNYNSYDNYLVGSAEQSFLYLFDRLDPNTKYVACTPCFRNEIEDELHQQMFMKVELFCKVPEFGIHMVRDAERFFMEEDALPFFKKTSEHSLDMEVNGIEVGSYYKRDNYCCGTGLAEPRFSIAVSKNVR